MAKARWSPQAKADLSAIWAYVAEDSVRAADRLLAQILQTVKLLEHFPSLGRRRDAIFAGLRSFGVGDYLVFYRLRAGRIEVARVLRGCRDLGSMFD